MAINYREPEIDFGGWTDKPGTGIIVTGAASGIGAATAILAAQSGYRVAAWDIFPQGIEETITRAGKFGENIKAIGADLASDEGVQKGLLRLLNTKYASGKESRQRGRSRFFDLKGALKSKGDAETDRKLLDEYLSEKYGV